MSTRLFSVLVLIIGFNFAFAAPPGHGHGGQGGFGPPGGGFGPGPGGFGPGGGFGPQPPPPWGGGFGQGGGGQGMMIDKSIKRMSDRNNTFLQSSVSSLTPEQKDRVLDLQRKIRMTIQQAGGQQNGQQLVESDSVAIANGTPSPNDWKTITVDVPATVSKLNLRAIGNGLVRIYRVNLVTVTPQGSLQNIPVQLPSQQIDLGNGQSREILTGSGSSRIAYIQVFAQGFSGSMNLGIDAFGSF